MPSVEMVEVQVSPIGHLPPGTICQRLNGRVDYIVADSSSLVSIMRSAFPHYAIDSSGWISARAPGRVFLMEINTDSLRYWRNRYMRRSDEQILRNYHSRGNDPITWAVALSNGRLMRFNPDLQVMVIQNPGTTVVFPGKISRRGRTIWELLMQDEE